MMMKKEDSNFNGESASMLINNMGGCFSQLVNKELESRLPDSHSMLPSSISQFRQQIDLNEKSYLQVIQKMEQ